MFVLKDEVWYGYSDCIYIFVVCSVYMRFGGPSLCTMYHYRMLSPSCLKIYYLFCSQCNLQGVCMFWLLTYILLHE